MIISLLLHVVWPSFSYFMFKISFTLKTSWMMKKQIDLHLKKKKKIRVSLISAKI